MFTFESGNAFPSEVAFNFRVTTTDPTSDTVMKQNEGEWSLAGWHEPGKFAIVASIRQR